MPFGGFREKVENVKIGFLNHRFMTEVLGAPIPRRYSPGTFAPNMDLISLFFLVVMVDTDDTRRTTDDRRHTTDNARGMAFISSPQVS